MQKWWTFIKEQPVAKRIHDEIAGAINGWFEGGRFENLGITDLVKENPERFSLKKLEAES
jgi:hypothetical protein